MDYHILTPFSFLLRIFEMFAQFSLVLSLLNSTSFLKKTLLGSIIFAGLFEFVKLIIPQYLSGIIAVILCIAFITVFFRIKILAASLSYLILGVIVALLDLGILMILSMILGGITINDMVKIPILYAVTSIIMSLVLLLIAYILRNIKNKIGISLKNMNKSGLVNAIVTFVLLVPNLVMLVYYYDEKEIPLLLIIINIGAIIAMFFVSTYNTKKGFELVTAEQELITQRTYNKTLQNLVDSLRTFKHDYNNTLQTMYGYIQLDNMIALKKFFEQILDESRAITALDKLNPELFNNPSLFGIITAKYEYARQNNVNLNFEMYGKIEDADMQMYDLTRILGIFLDNAIEAATGSEKKKVNLMVTDRKGKIIIEISNTYSEVGLKVEDIDKKGVSSKGENRGLGLYKVKDILKKYPIVQHETTAINGMFRQKLVINKIRVKV